MTIRKTVLACVAASAAAVAFAQENENEAQPAAEGVANPVVGAVGSKLFTELPFCHVADGAAQVLLPLETEWKQAEEGRFYPLGTRCRASEGGKLELSFGSEASATIEGDGEFVTRAQNIGEKVRTIELCRGTVSVTLARNTPQGAFFVVGPGFKVKNPAGESKYVYMNKGDGDFVSVRCVTGTLGIEGLHFDIPELRAANELHIRSTHDNLLTFLYGISGDYIVKIDRGVAPRVVIDDNGERKTIVEPSILDWHLSPETKVRIDRLKPAVGERMSVSVMTFDAAGQLKNNFAYAEGCAEINSGELVKLTKEESADVAKRAAEATETAAVDVEDDKADDSEAGEKKQSDNE